MADADIGKLGNYDSCSFTSRGIGRFRPLRGASPAIGTIGTLEEVEEERIEAMVETTSQQELNKLLHAIRSVHPYEEPAIHVLPMLDI